MVKRVKTSVAEPLPQELAGLARAVVARYYGAEVEAFDDILADFEADPDGTVRGVRLAAPVGIGIELAAMSPWVLAAAGVVGGVLAEKAADEAYGAARRWLTGALARRKNEQVAESPPEPVAEAPGQVTILITLHLQGLGASESLAREIAERVVDELGSDGHTDGPEAG